MTPGRTGCRSGPGSRCGGRSPSACCWPSPTSRSTRPSAPIWSAISIRRCGPSPRPSWRPRSMASTFTCTKSRAALWRRGSTPRSSCRSSTLMAGSVSRRRRFESSRHSCLSTWFARPSAGRRHSPPSRWGGGTGGPPCSPRRSARGRTPSSLVSIATKSTRISRAWPGCSGRSGCAASWQPRRSVTGWRRGHSVPWCGLPAVPSELPRETSPRDSIPRPVRTKLER